MRCSTNHFLLFYTRNAENENAATFAHYRHVESLNKCGSQYRPSFPRLSRGHRNFGAQCGAGAIGESYDSKMILPQLWVYGARKLRRFSLSGCFTIPGGRVSCHVRASDNRQQGFHREVYSIDMPVHFFLNFEGHNKGARA